MWTFLKRKLGILEIFNRITDARRQLFALDDDIERLSASIDKLERSIRVHNTALGRLIAKLEPNFARDELDPVRKAESDALGEAAINRIVAENAALRRPE